MGIACTPRSLILDGKVQIQAGIAGIVVPADEHERLFPGFDL